MAAVWRVDALRAGFAGAIAHRYFPQQRPALRAGLTVFLNAVPLTGKRQQIRTCLGFRSRIEALPIESLLPRPANMVVARLQGNEGLRLGDNPKFNGQILPQQRLLSYVASRKRLERETIPK
jgi:hypothetical protein